MAECRCPNPVPAGLIVRIPALKAPLDVPYQFPAQGAVTVIVLHKAVHAVLAPYSTHALVFVHMFFGNWADLMIGDQMGLETYTTLDGTWTDENGVQHNAFEENLTGTRALMYDDIGVRHVESFAYVHNIKVI